MRVAVELEPLQADWEPCQSQGRLPTTIHTHIHTEGPFWVEPEEATVHGEKPHKHRMLQLIRTKKK